MLMHAPIQQTISISDLLESRENIAPLFPLEILGTPPIRFDLSRHNPALRPFSLGRLKSYIIDAFDTTTFQWGYGGLGEGRDVDIPKAMLNDSHMEEGVHLGIDLWLPSHTPIFAPMAGTITLVHSDSQSGVTIITEHRIADTMFHILLRRISRKSIDAYNEGMKVRYGDQIGTVGGEDENPVLPPHIHLQIIADLQNKKGDFPGVAKLSDKEKYLALCPNPEPLLKPFLVA